MSRPTSLRDPATTLGRIADTLAAHGLRVIFVDAHDPSQVLYPGVVELGSVTDLNERRRSRESH